MSDDYALMREENYYTPCRSIYSFLDTMLIDYYAEMSAMIRCWWYFCCPHADYVKSARNDTRIITCPLLSDDIDDGEIWCYERWWEMMIRDERVWRVVDVFDDITLFIMRVTLRYAIALMSLLWWLLFRLITLLMIITMPCWCMMMMSVFDIDVMSDIMSGALLF